MSETDQRWTRTDESGQSQSIIATPSRVINGESVFEITEAALAELLSKAGFEREDEGR